MDSGYYAACYAAPASAVSSAILPPTTKNDQTCMVLMGVRDGKSGELAGLGRWQAPDKGEVRPTPAFRLLRVGAELCLIET